jgi:NAD-dependent SIR2 family protein deacetylase
MVFFLGAGFTKAVAPNAPNGRQFFEKGFSPDNQLLEIDQIRKLKEFVETVYYPLTDEGILPRIEDVMSLVDYCVQQKQGLNQSFGYDEILDARDSIVFLMRKLIQESVEMHSNYELADNFVHHLNHSDLNATVATTNYDIVIDNALLRRAGSCNYGIRLRSSNNVQSGVRPLPLLDRNQGPLNRGKIPLLKIHGSLNWLWCPKCDEIDLVWGEKATIEDASRQFCANEYCTENYQPLLITPTMFKAYDGRHLRKLLQLFQEAIEGATDLVFIGYSFPDADYLVRSVLTRGLSRNSRASKVRVVVVDNVVDHDPKAPTHIADLQARYSSVFGNRVLLETIGLSGFVERFDEVMDKAESSMK